ncbi:MAG: ABC transporter ATP-binding protein [bacterium]|nr:ABC transporter ATP-binding protein [bacterium]
MFSRSEDEVAIRFSHVDKTYRLFKNDRARFYSVFNKRVKHETIHANCDLSFEIKRGEAVALVGNNGAGKSTALKIITGVITPTSGTVDVNGRVSALLELSAGFDMNLTGRENIEMRGFLWGLNKKEIAELTPAVEEFAELGSYFDQPMRTYSSGMKARLGFSFASSIDPEILVVDEALSVGDKRFSKKCIARVKEIMSGTGVTVLFVTHSSSAAQEFCTRGLVLDHGRLTYDGPIKDAIEFYDKSNNM